jgi:hypothetical protein
MPQLTLCLCALPPYVADIGNRSARIIISTDWHVKRYFEYGAVVKMALNHFRRFCRLEQVPYTTKDGELISCTSFQQCLFHALAAPSPKTRHLIMPHLS